MQLRRDMLPAALAKGVQLYLITIGTAARGLEFCEKTGFPPEHLLADPDNVCYSAVGFKKGVKETFLSWQTPEAIWKRIQAGKTDDLQGVLKNWVPWNPPQLDQALQQGGVLVFEGEHLLLAHYDASTGSHADLDVVLRIATEPAKP